MPQTSQYATYPSSESTYRMQDVDHLVLKVLEVQDIRQKMHQLQEELNWEKQNFESLQGETRGRLVVVVVAAGCGPHSCELWARGDGVLCGFSSTDSAERPGLLGRHAEAAESHPAAGVQSESNVLGE